MRVTFHPALIRAFAARHLILILQRDPRAGVRTRRRPRPKALATLIAAAILVVTAGIGSAAEPAAPAGLHPQTVRLPGAPFGAVITADEQWVFVSLAGGRRGVAVLPAHHGQLDLVRVVPLPSPPTGIVLTHDGRLLIAAAGDSVLFLDVKRLESGEAPVVGMLSDGKGAGSIYVNVTADDRTLFVSDERAATITVIDLAAARRGKFDRWAIIGQIPVGHAPIALTFSPDEHWLFTTSEIAPRTWGWPDVIPREGQTDDNARGRVPEGAVLVIDVAKARRQPKDAVVARVPAGGSPVRLGLSPTGDRLYVTARNSDALVIFDSARLVSDPSHARIARIAVGRAPVPIGLADHGKMIVVGNSNRFGADADAPSTLTVIDATRIEAGQGAVLGTVSVGAFPRDLRLAPDGRTLLLTNARSQTLQVLDSWALPIQRTAH